MQPAKALKWIVNILNKHDIPFQATGGLATKAFGSKRKLVTSTCTYRWIE
ncbi:hypothetical protein GWO43_29865 [candidate division KSB1 bacterium]|nr:hypothetical protein [candidate division KSB1 bacterium]NIR73234.1 hypothetical protein [candidate division KSB1 bacterium]NIT74992.1 hypothetical protein [candidate division KSB1 bacterium]NIU29081.1 hypothetical protein [candidate division KSB1 bacterium]NIV96287.1 hypothetical protein [candidate division KSB1 bacterium]